MPVSSEQILHPERYKRGDRPVELRVVSDAPRMYEDVLGENEIRVILAMLAGSDEVQTVVPIGWGGDRYRSSPKRRTDRRSCGSSLWDDARAADRFMRAAAAGLRKTARPGYRTSVDELKIDGSPGVRYVIAPEKWEGWSALPGVKRVR